MKISNCLLSIIVTKSNSDIPPPHILSVPVASCQSCTPHTFSQVLFSQRNLKI